MLHHRPYNQHLSHVTGWHGGLDGYSSAFYDPFQIKHRRRTTPAQLGVLEAQFESNCKPDVVLRKQLAEQLDMTPREVQVWFQNRRAKTKKLEKRAEQESGKPGGETEGNPFISNQVTLSPPTSVFTGPSSGHACGLTVVRNESPEEDSLASNREQVDEGDSENSVLTHHRLEAERRIRSHSLHHHPYFLPPWSNQHPNQSNALSSLVTNSMFSSSGPSDEESKSSDRRDSHASIASSMTTTNSSIAITPTTTDFVHDDAITMVTGSGYPDGYDPRRRSSCPAEFIQSFDHFGLSQHAISSLHPLATNFESGSASQTSCDSKTQSEWMNGGSQATALDPCNSSYLSNWTGGVEDWKLDASREGGLPRRHSMASIRASEPVRISQLGQQSVNEEHSFMVFSENKAPNRIEKPIKIMGGCSNGVGPGGYARRSSTSVLLNSIEEHPVSSWNP
ncbi:hypothetical protein BY996DRAFT_4604767 [Phakopsora pachyrhizi]|uniref:Expressed protein n=1 Tax=Phakopsora pachyrhizi TaxID=170000 RepID=A0AAV0ANQ4_PHAPC|nr:hypothetical protein BY996DRAFT_4604767 [Phakopsora pachyrhizi]CAH7669941.1 expressed protein [Phakopsora pachyrhizi]